MNINRNLKAVKSAVTLSVDEQSIINAFRKLSADVQKVTVRVVQGYADIPSLCAHEKPVLELICGGKQ